MAQVTKRVIIHDGPDGTKTMHVPEAPCLICWPDAGPLTDLLEEHQWNGDDTISDCTCGIFCPDIPTHQARLIIEAGWRPTP
jgi:hypothetical protein